jgi:hypothetical protein
MMKMKSYGGKIVGRRAAVSWADGWPLFVEEDDHDDRDHGGDDAEEDEAADEHPQLLPPRATRQPVRLCTIQEENQLK